MPAKSIARVSMPSEMSFFTDYVSTQTPVIITNVFEGQAIREIKTLSLAKKVLGDTKLVVRSEYATANRISAADEQVMTFNDYWDVVENDLSTTLLCTEYEIPAGVMRLFELPSVCVSNRSADHEILGFPLKYGDFDLLGNVFLANKENKAHLHYDGDHRQVLLYQMFGIKKVLLFPPESAVGLRPLDGPFFSGAGVFIDKMSEGEREELLDKENGYSAILYPGETIYMPSLMWHHLEYVDSAMSFNLRFGRNIYGRFMSVDNFHRDVLMQNFASHLGGRLNLIDLRFKEGASSLATDYLAPTDGLRSKVKLVRKKLRLLCDELCPTAHCDECCPPHREEEELDRIMRDIGQTMRYADPKIISQTRPCGVISGVQKQQLESKAVICGYSPDVLRRLLFNRLGKGDLDELTRVEAASFLAFMRSPGAFLR